VGYSSIHGAHSVEGTEKAVDHRRSTAFLLAHAMGDDVMQRSVLEHALQTLQAVDERIVQLIELRRHLAAQLAQAAPCRDRPHGSDARHSPAISRLIRSNPGPLEARQLAAIFATVIEVTEPPANGLPPSNGAAKKG
jgi:chorismate mutase